MTIIRDQDRWIRESTSRMTQSVQPPHASVFNRRPWGGSRIELRFQRRDARFQRLVFLAGEPRHVLDRLELLALDDVEVAQDFFGLVAHHGVDLALDALRGAGGVVHQAADLVEKPIVGLGHVNISGCGSVLTMAIRADLFKAGPKPYPRVPDAVRHSSCRSA